MGFSGERSTASPESPNGDDTASSYSLKPFPSAHGQQDEAHLDSHSLQQAPGAADNAVEAWLSKPQAAATQQV